MGGVREEEGFDEGEGDDARSDEGEEEKGVKWRRNNPRW